MFDPQRGSGLNWADLQEDDRDTCFSAVHAGLGGGKQAKGRAFSLWRVHQPRETLVEMMV